MAIVSLMEPDSRMRRPCRGRLACLALAGLLLGPAGCGWVEVPASRATGMGVPVDNRGAPAVQDMAPRAVAPTAAPAVAGDVAPIPPGGAVIARAGDSVYGLSRRYGVPMRAIIEANNMSPPFHLLIGQRVALPAGRVHVVSNGENLHAIARQYDADPYALARANGIDDARTVYAGQRLYIPDAQRGGPVSASPPPRSVAAGDGTAGGGPVSPASSVQVSSLPDLPQPAPEPAPAAAPPPPSADTTAPVTAAPPPPAAVARMASIPAPPPLSGDGFLWPVEGKIISGFGPQERGLHNDGLNIAAPRGTEVRAAQAGVVAYAGNELRGFGNLLLIKHEDGWVTAYAHNGALLVRAGDKVTRGQVIARVGSSGSVSEPQLHFELRRGPQPVDPLGHLKAPVG